MLSDAAQFFPDYTIMQHSLDCITFSNDLHIEVLYEPHGPQILG